MSQVFSNNAVAVLSADVLISGDTLTLGVGQGALFQEPIPGDYELVTLHTRNYSKWEIVSVTTRVADSMTVTRGVEGTQQPWVAGDFVTANVTAKTLTDLVVLAEAAQADATQALSDAAAAQVTADEALAAVSGVSANASALPVFATYEVYTDGVSQEGAWASSQYNTLSLSGSVLLARNTGTEGSATVSLPSMGFHPEEWARVNITRNGVPCNVVLNRFTDWVDDYNLDHNTVQIFGHRYLRFWPPLERFERVEVYAPRATWHQDGRYNTWAMMYENTGVTYSFLAGGTGQDGSGNLSGMQRFEWANHVSILYTSTYVLTTAMPYGMGAISDEVQAIWWFGGNVATVGNTRIHKLIFNPLTAISSNIKLPATTNGCSFTDLASAWLCGVGANNTDTAIYKFTIAGETVADTGLNVVGATFTYPSAFCDGTYGSIFSQDDDLGDATWGQFQKFTCATDAISAPVDMTANCLDGSSALLFRDGNAFLWKGTGADQLHRWSTVLDTIQASMHSYVTADGENAHNVVCDGEHYAHSVLGCMLCNTTEAISITKQRHQRTTTAYIERVHNPVGAATDYWGKC